MLSVTHGIGPPVVSRKADLHKYLTVIHNGYVSLQLWVCPKGSSMGEGVLCWGFVTCIVEVPGISSLSFKNIPMSDGDPCRRKKCVFLLVLNVASDLLGLDAFQLSEVLTQRSMILRGEEISSPLTVEQVSVLPLLALLHFQALSLPPVSLFPAQGLLFFQVFCPYW